MFRTLTIAFTLVVILSTGAVAQRPAGPATILRIVNQIEFQGNTLIPSSELAGVVGIKPGELLTGAKLNQAETDIEQAYRKRGYLAVVADDILDRFQQTGTLTFPIVEAKVAEVRIDGLHKTKDYVVRRMLEQKPGEYYSVPAVNRDAERIFALNIFKSVDADVLPTETPGFVLLVWRLVENPKTQNFQLGGSYAPSERLVADVTYLETNLRGRAQQLGITANIGTIRTRLGGEVFFTDPWIARNRSITYRVFNNIRYKFSESLEPGISHYYERHLGGQVLTTKTQSATAKLTTGARYENVTVYNLPLQNMTVMQTSANAHVAAVSAEYVDDRRDNSIYPTTGRLLGAMIEPGWTQQESDGNNWIFKPSIRARRFIPLDRVTTVGVTGNPMCRPRVLAGRLAMGTSFGSLPFFEQYMVGGVYGMRGYLEQRYWGRHMVLGTVEYRQPIRSKLTAIAFVDVGDAWDSRFQFVPGATTEFTQHKSFTPHVGTGLGMRYNTSYGPLGLDFAYGHGFHTHLVLGPAF